MKIKLSKFERVAGIFLIGAVIGSIAMTAGVAIKKGWFTKKIHFETNLDNAEGIHPGTVVQMSGLRAGDVTEIELLNTERVRIKFKVLEHFAARVKKDSYVQVIRPFVIGEKVLDLTIGSEGSEVLLEGGFVNSKHTVDLMDLVSGKSMNEFLSTFGGLVDSFKVLANAFADPARTKALVKTLDRMEPLVLNMNLMSKEVTKVTRSLNKDGRIEELSKGLALISKELGIIIPQLSEQSPKLGQDLAQLVSSMKVLATEFEKLTPTISKVAPELPHASLRALEALDEAVVLLKAMQKSFILKGNVEEVREEEKRSPASK